MRTKFVADATALAALRRHSQDDMVTTADNSQFRFDAASTASHAAINIEAGAWLAMQKVDKAG